MMQRVCIFCGSHTGSRPVYIAAAHEMGVALAQRGIDLVYGGGHVGLMGILADTVLKHGGRVIGIMPQHLFDKEIAHNGLTELRVVGSMHERKALMATLADAFIALPGGYGTFEEFCEILTWGQLGLHHKPCGLLNVKGFYDPLLALFDHAVSEGFVREIYRTMVLVDTDPTQLLNRFEAYQPPAIPKWMDLEQT